MGHKPNRTDLCHSTARMFFAQQGQPVQAANDKKCCFQEGSEITFVPGVTRHDFVLMEH